MTTLLSYRYASIINIYIRENNLLPVISFFVFINIYYELTSIFILNTECYTTSEKMIAWVAQW